MDSCYLGESFEKKFKVSNGPVASASFKIYAPDGSILDQGLMGIDDKILSFRFTAEAVGMNIIEVTWTTGQDIWKSKALMEVRP